MQDHKKIAVFFDRDGVLVALNEYNRDKNLEFITRKEDLELLPGAVEAVILLNKRGIEIIIVTNQPQVARGLIDEKAVQNINKEFEEMLKRKGAKIDASYYCPHHPSAGTSSYTIKCACRKPLPGMLLQAAKEHDIDLKNSFIIGDRISDIKAGQLAGCKSIGVKTGYACNDGFADATPDYMADDVLSAVNYILERIISTN